MHCRGELSLSERGMVMHVRIAGDFSSLDEYR